MFWSNRDNVDDLWLVGADHSPARRFILDSVARQYPRISPDGSHILYSGHY
jgi:Tol biopolymer transport system component